MYASITTTDPMFACPAPPWANEPTDWHIGTAEHHRYAQRPLRVCAWLEQLDELDVTDGVVTFVRHQPTIMIQFDSSGDTFTSDMLPVDQFRHGWMPPMPATITAERITLAQEAVAELLVVLDSAVTA
jgi:hypothetical protein